MEMVGKQSRYSVLLLYQFQTILHYSTSFETAPSRQCFFYANFGSSCTLIVDPPFLQMSLDLVRSTEKCILSGPPPSLI